MTVNMSSMGNTRPQPPLGCRCLKVVRIAGISKLDQKASKSGEMSATGRNHEGDENG